MLWHRMMCEFYVVARSAVRAACCGTEFCIRRIVVRDKVAHKIVRLMLK